MAEMQRVLTRMEFHCGPARELSHTERSEQSFSRGELLGAYEARIGGPAYESFCGYQPTNGSLDHGFFVESSEAYHNWTHGLETAIRDMDPFQNGAHTTMPASYVGRQLTYAGYP